MLHALLLEDDKISLEALERLVRGLGFEVHSAQTVQQARQLIAARLPDLAVLDLDLPDGNGAELVEELEPGRRAEVIVHTGHGSIASAVEATRAGVLEYLTKPLDIDRFERALRDVKRILALRRDLREMYGNLTLAGRFDQLVGTSPVMRDMYDMLVRVAPTSATVMLTGETGVGKERVAETIHRLSPRSGEALVAVNCGAVQPTLIESELFGHEAGSFTGANKAHRGMFEQARGGTLFLDEVTEMPLELQVKLLRVLETRTAKRVGGESDFKVDVRMIATTNRSPEQAVREGRLREDLFYRLNVFPITVPPLRKREGDIPLLATYMLDQLNQQHGWSKSFSMEALDQLEAHRWPGNVRELRNAVERSAIMAGDRILPEHLKLEGDPGGGSSSSSALPSVGASIAEVEKQHILLTLERYSWDKKQAAKVLGISLKTLYNRLNSYGLGARGPVGRPNA